MASLFKSSNNAWRDFPRNPQGRARFAAMLRFSPAHLASQTSRLAPCLAAKRAPARPCVKRQQTLGMGAAQLIKLTCAATMRQVPASFTQLCCWRPILSLPLRVNSVLHTAKLSP